MFSDILTPLPAVGIEFDIVRGRGPCISTPIRRHAARSNGLPCTCGFPVCMPRTALRKSLHAFRSTLSIIWLAMLGPLPH